MMEDDSYFVLNDTFKEKTQSNIMMSAFTKIIKRASKYDQISQKDIEDVPFYMEPVESIYPKYKIYWDKEKEKPTPSLMSMCYKITLKNFWISFIWAAVYEILILSYPVLLPFLISFTIEYTDEYWKGIAIFLPIVVTSYIAPIAQGYCGQYALITARETSIGVFCLLYEKILKSPRGTFSSDALSFFFTQSNSIFENMTIFEFSLMSILKVIIGITLLGMCLQWYCMIVVLFLILDVIIIFLLGRIYKEIILEQAKVTNKRAAMEYEVIKQIEFIKYYMWEHHFLNKVVSAKEKELRALFKKKRVYFSIHFMGVHFVAIGSFITILLYAFIEGFSTILFLRTIIAITYITSSCRLLILPFHFYSSWKACAIVIEDWLLNPKKLPLKLTTNEPGHIIINNATLSWDKQPVLSDVSLDIQKGEFVMIIGSFGSGKSTLASAILNEVPLLSGTVLTGGTYAYIPSQTWTPHGTIRYNILMGKEYNEKWYIEVLKAVDLFDDLKALPDGDMTVVSSSGTNLSGGQLQRISIARALYSDRDIYVLDDVLSALDNKVAKNVFHGGIINLLQKQNKTIVMILSQIEYLSYSDRVLVIANGKIFKSGPFNQLILDKNFEQFMRKHYPDFENSDKVNKEDVIEQFFKKEENIEDTFQKEEVMPNTFLWNVFKEYIKGGGILKYSFSIFLNAMYIVGIMGCNWWMLLVWIPNAVGYSVTLYAGFYAFLNIFLIGLAISNLYLHVYHATKTYKYFHMKIIRNILLSPVLFFEKTGIGKILNVLQSDLLTIGLEIPDSMWSMEYWGLCIICSGISAAIGAPIVLIIVVIIIILYIPWHRNTMNAIIKLQNMASISRPPLYSHYKDTLEGVSSIRVFNLSDIMVQEVYKSINKMFRNVTVAWGCVLWYTARAHLFGTTMIVCSFTWILLNIIFNWIPIDNNKEAFAFVLAGSVVYYFSIYAFTASRLTAKMVHAEKATQYFNLETEPINIDRNININKDWIKTGTVSFENVTMLYKGHTKKRLNNVSFFIENGQRIGILGRTGAGKSSLFKAMMRFHEITSGKIKISDVDISNLRLEDLRASITIIPQTPTIFTDSLRNNLDPFKEYSDESLFLVLKQVYLDNFLQSLPHGLDSEISDISMALGEKQLLCFARAILKQSKIVIMDEATASLDVETELLIHRLMKENFKNSTVLWIAHHLTTVMEFDKLLLMDQGKVIEFDTPFELIKNEKGMFSQLVNSTGEKTSLFLKELALKYSKK